jgi:hypothetical protein
MSLKVGKEMDIGGAVAPVILAMVGVDFFRTVPWEVMLFRIRPRLFLY